jgi:hypothetical protein
MRELIGHTAWTQRWLPFWPPDATDLYEFSGTRATVLHGQRPSRRWTAHEMAPPEVRSWYRERKPTRDEP